MSIDENPLENSAGSGTNTRLLFVCLAVLLAAAAVAGAWLLIGSRPGPAPSAAPPAATATATASTPVASAPAATEPAPSAPAAAAARRASRKPKAAASPEPAAPVLALTVDSDVSGASVFLDRTYIGKTPLTTSDVTPGSHVVLLSAEGYESQSNTIDLTAGANDVMVRFKVVRLNEAVAVVHKHTIGSCEGRLVADVTGLRYETPNKDHAMAVPFSELRAFEVDYLKKNLRLTRKDGKTFNFTDRNANADALFVFHKKVEAARAKLASGFTPDR